MEYRKTILKERDDGKYSLTVVTHGVTYIIDLTEDQLSSFRRYLNGLAGSGREVPAEIRTEMVDMLLPYTDWYPMVEPLNEWFDDKLKRGV